MAGTAAASSGLALYRTYAGALCVYVLYDCNVLEQEITSMDPSEYGGLDPNNYIYGYMEVKPHKGECWNAAEVKCSAARKGYGPLLYEIAMSDFGTLMSDHGAGSSMSARQVWKKYEQRSDVQKKAFDDVKEPKTPPKEDDCKLIPDFEGENQYLNNAYSGAGDDSGKLALLQAHQNFIKKFQQHKSDLESAIMGGGDEYFGQRYREN